MLTDTPGTLLKAIAAFTALQKLGFALESLRIGANHAHAPDEQGWVVGIIVDHQLVTVWQTPHRGASTAAVTMVADHWNQLDQPARRQLFEQHWTKADSLTLLLTLSQLGLRSLPPKVGDA